MNLITRATPTTLSAICMTPARITAAIRKSTPWSRANGYTTRATAPVAAEIIAGRPPTTAIVTAIVNDAYKPSLGSTPARIENEIASGMSASATARPASNSTRRRRADRNAANTDVSSDSSATARETRVGGGEGEGDDMGIPISREGFDGRVRPDRRPGAHHPG